MQCNKNIPELRFPEFKEEWEEKKLSQIIYKAKAGGTPKSSIKEYYNGNIPFLSINDMTNEGKYITYTEKSITEKGLKNSSAWLVPEKSLLYSMYASVGFVSINNIPLTTSQAIFNIIFKEQVSLEFMYYYLTFYKRYIHKYIETGTQGNLNAKLIKNFKIKIPSKEEQEKIANFLTCIDQKISFMEKKYTILENYYKSLIHQTYAFNQNKPKITFSNMNWEEISLNDILDEINIKSTENNQYPLLSSTVNGIFLQDEYFDRNVGSKDNTGYKIISKNEIVFSPQNLWMGNINVNDKFEKGIVSPSYKIFKTNKKVKIGFLKHLLKTERMIYEYKLSSEQGASIVRKNLNMNLFLDIKIKIPSIEEQEKIARLMEYIMSHRDKIKKEINIAKEFKKTMLSKMFC